MYAHARRLVRSLLTGSLALTIGAGGCIPDTPAPPPARKPVVLAPAKAPAPIAATPSNAPVTPAARPAPTALGMEEPFAKLSTEATRELQKGHKAMKGKRHAEARAAFARVVAAYPDHTTARYQELRAAALAGDFGAAPDLVRELLARDFVGWNEVLDQAKDLSGLRRSPQWKDVEHVREELRRAYGRGLDGGVTFVARARRVPPPTYDDRDEAKVTFEQEVYHYDPRSGRTRRLTATGGRVLAVHREPGKPQLVVVLARTLKRQGTSATIVEPEAMLLSLDGNDTVGPMRLPVEASAVELCVSSKGEPVWLARVGDERRAFTLDSTRSALVPVGGACPPQGAMTLVTLQGAEHRRAGIDGVTVAEDGATIEGVDGERPLRATERVRPGSLAWSPGRKRFSYAGHVDLCDAAAKSAQSLTIAPNALYVWNATEKKAAKVDARVGSYEAEWLDDDRLAYEIGTGPKTQVVIHAFTGDKPIELTAPGGASLHGLPAVDCTDAGTQAFAD